MVPPIKEREHYNGKTDSSEDAPIDRRMKNNVKIIREDCNPRTHHELDEETRECIDWRKLEEIEK